MNRKRVFTLVTYMVAFLLPILGMMNCSGFNAANGAVQECYIDASFLRSYANFHYGWIMISSFIFFLPIIIYIILVIGLVRMINRFIRK